VVNLDMVGEDQALCGGPFVVERNPDCRPAPIGLLAEHVVGEVFARTTGEGGTWRPAPFLGLSDHAVFAGPALGAPAVHLCHFPDRFNHSAQDDLDKVSPGELRRATAAGAALAYAVARDEPPPRELVRAWCERERAAAERVGREHGEEWSRRLLRYVDERNAELLSLLDHGPAPARSDGGSGLRAGWEGPLNVRPVFARLSPGTRREVARLLREDKQHHALLANFAIRADGRRSRAEIVEETSFALRRPLPAAVADPLFDALLEAGWVVEAPPPGC
jgi:hypothetical protein